MYANITRNRKSEVKQIKNGLMRSLSNLYESVPILQEEIIKFYSTKGIDIVEEEIENLVHQVSVEEFQSNVSDFVYEMVYKMGAKNEFDGILLTDDGIITIEIKSTQPTMKQLEKLDSFSKHLSPIRGNSNFLIYNWVWENNPKGVKKKKKLDKAVENSKLPVHLMPFDKLFSLSPTNK